MFRNLLKTHLVVFALENDGDVHLPNVKGHFSASDWSISMCSLSSSSMELQMGWSSFFDNFPLSFILKFFGGLAGGEIWQLSLGGIWFSEEVVPLTKGEVGVFEAVEEEMFRLGAAVGGRGGADASGKFGFPSDGFIFTKLNGSFEDEACGRPAGSFPNTQLGEWILFISFDFDGIGVGQVGEKTFCGSCGETLDEEFTLVVLTDSSLSVFGKLFCLVWERSFLSVWNFLIISFENNL